MVILVDMDQWNGINGLADASTCRESGPIETHAYPLNMQICTGREGNGDDDRLRVDVDVLGDRATGAFIPTSNFKGHWCRRCLLSERKDFLSIRHLSLGRGWYATTSSNLTSYRPSFHRPSAGNPLQASRCLHSHQARDCQSSYSVLFRLAHL